MIQKKRPEKSGRFFCWQHIGLFLYRIAQMYKVAYGLKK